MPILEEAIEQFNKLPIEIQLECSSEEYINALQTLERIYKLPLSGVAVQIIVGNFQFSSLSSDLQCEFSLNTQTAEQLAQDLKEKVFRTVIERLNFLNSNPEKDMTLEQEKNFAENLFHTALVKELHHHPLIISAINDRLFYILARDEQFKERLARALYENSEKITSHILKLKTNEQVPSTVSNWLKDYIAQYGSQAYDSLNQSKFLSSSKNVKLLSDVEKTLVAKVLRTYLNIAFFPDSMPSDDGEGWEIIPVDQPEKGAVLNKKLESLHNETTPTPKDKVTPDLDHTLTRTTPSLKQKPPLKSTSDSSVRPASKPQPTFHSVETSSELLKLKNMLLQYPPHSLERQAIEDEIKKLEKV